MAADILRDRFRFFRSLPPGQLEQFLEFCERHHVAAGDALWREGDQTNFAAFILDGKVSVKKRTEFSHKHVVVGIYSAGSVIGELCLLTNNPRAVSAEAIEPTELLVLHSERFEEMLTRFPQAGLSLLRHIFTTTSRRLTKSYERIATIF